jgi:hypothetical protein
MTISKNTSYIPNKLLRRTFGPKREDMSRGWRKLHNEKLYNLHSSSCTITIVKTMMIRWAEHVALTGEKRNAYRILVGKPEGKKPPGKSRHRWEVNIKMDLREIRWCGTDWIRLAQDREQWRALVNTVMNLRVP